MDFTDEKGKEQSIMQGSEYIKELQKSSGIETSWTSLPFHISPEIFIFTNSTTFSLIYFRFVWVTNQNFTHSFPICG